MPTRNFKSSLDRELGEKKNNKGNIKDKCIQNVLYIDRFSQLYLCFDSTMIPWSLKEHAARPSNTDGEAQAPCALISFQHFRIKY
jgi:hypothetical protein